MYVLSNFEYEFQCDFPFDLLNIIYYKLYLAYSFFYRISKIAIRVNIYKFIREIFKFSYTNIRGSRSIEYQISSGTQSEILVYHTFVSRMLKNSYTNDPNGKNNLNSIQVQCHRQYAIVHRLKSGDFTAKSIRNLYRKYKIK